MLPSPQAQADPMTNITDAMDTKARISCFIMNTSNLMYFLCIWVHNKRDKHTLIPSDSVFKWSMVQVGLHTTQTLPTLGNVFITLLFIMRYSARTFYGIDLVRWHCYNTSHAALQYVPYGLGFRLTTRSYTPLRSIRLHTAVWCYIDLSQVYGMPSCNGLISLYFLAHFIQSCLTTRISRLSISTNLLCL